MKTLFVAATLTLTTLTITASAQENQTAKAKALVKGRYTEHEVKYENGVAAFSQLSADPLDVAADTFHTDFFEIKISNVAGTSSLSYFPDEEAFPATYIKGRRKDHPKGKYLNVVEYTSSERVVLLNGYVYILEKWKSKDDFQIRSILLAGEYKGLKLTKEAMAAPKKFTEAKHEETLKAYLNEAFKKQEEMLPAWKEKNQALIAQWAANEVRYQAIIDSINGNYWNSAEGKRNLNNMQKAKVTFVNDSKSEVRLCYGSGAWSVLKPGEQKVFSCDDGKVYKGKARENSEQPESTGQVLFNLDGNNCGTELKATNYGY